MNAIVKRKAMPHDSGCRVMTNYGKRPCETSCRFYARKRLNVSVIGI